VQRLSQRRLRSDPPPLAYWLLPAVVALLRMQPYRAALALVPPPGAYGVDIGYNPKDTLTYLSFIRQAAEHGSIFFHDQFTTEPHAPRFILLLYWVLGRISAATGWSATVVFETSRVPLTFLLFAVLWGFLRPILPERRTRLIAATLIGLSGGIDWLCAPLFALTSGKSALQFAVDTQPAFGWSTFDGMFNPLWVAGLTLSLVVLRPILAPRGPDGWRDRAALGLGLPLLFLVHSYTAIVVVAVAVVRPLVEAALAPRVDWRCQRRIWIVLAPVGLALLLVARWQAQDPVYRVTSSNAFGPELMSPFWYPLTLGAILLLALRGARLWVRDAHPYRFSLLAWIATVAWLHSSPLLNGYHFVPYLHLPMCVVAAGALDEAWSRRQRAAPRDWALAGVTAVALFASPLVVTAGAIADVAASNLYPQSYARVVVDLAGRPAGNALVPPALGNLLPAYTPHRVWAGHWFLTPDEATRAARYEQLTGDPQRAAELRDLIARERIDYVVVPAARADAVAQALGPALVERAPQGGVELLVLRPSSAAQLAAAAP
jgi:hypothetical protein